MKSKLTGPRDVIRSEFPDGFTGPRLSARRDVARRVEGIVRAHHLLPCSAIHVFIFSSARVRASAGSLPLLADWRQIDPVPLPRLVD